MNDSPGSPEDPANQALPLAADGSNPVNSLLDRLAIAVDADDEQDVVEACEALRALLATRAEAYSPAQITQILELLRSVRAFNALATIAEMSLQASIDDPVIRRLYAQALIENGQLAVAYDVLNRLAEQLPTDHPEHREALGLLGRVDKQVYAQLSPQADGGRRANVLWTGIRHYFAGFDLGNIVGTNWYGINVVALMMRGCRDGVDSCSPDEAQGLALRIVNALADAYHNANTDPWITAVAGEACVALDDFETAAMWYSQFAASERTSRFQLASALRQLTEIWQLSPGSEPGGGLIASLQARLLAVHNGAVELSTADIAAINDLADDKIRREAVLGDDGPVLISQLKAGLRAARGVGRIRDRDSGETLGTGFVADGGELHPRLTGRTVLITAQHVVGGLPYAAALSPEFAEVVFDEHDRRTAFACGTLIWQSPEHELDVSVIELELGTAPIARLDLAADDALPSDPATLGSAQCHAVVIGHPAGGGLAISLSDCRIVDLGGKPSRRVEAQFIHYRSPTRGGSSGGPVFAANNWQVIAIHSGGPANGRGIRRLGGKAGRHLANEGVLISAVRAAMAVDLAVEPTLEIAAPAVDDVLVDPPMPQADSLPTELREQLQRLDVSDRELRHNFWVNKEKSVPFRPTVEIDPAAPVDLGGAAAADAEEPIDLATAAASALPEAAEDVIDLGLPPPAAPVPSMPKKSAVDGVARERVPMAIVEGLNAVAHWRRMRFYRQKISAGWNGLKLIAEGDSWFQYPFVLDDIVDQMSGSYAICCIAGAGHTLQAITASQELPKAILSERPDGVLLSGGGNDLLGEATLTLHLNDFQPGLAPEGYFRDSIGRHLDLMLDFYTQLIEGALKVDPALNLFVHGYDWPIPDPEKGGWLGAPMVNKGIKDVELQRQLIHILIDRFNDKIAGLEASYPGKVHYVDCRGAVGGVDNWYDELHPNDAGFARIAERFRTRIADVLARS